MEVMFEDFLNWDPYCLEKREKENLLICRLQWLSKFHY